jgi:zinc finger protein
VTEISTCPYCAKKSLELRKFETAVPFFGKVFIMTSVCSSCGYKHSDIVCLEDHGPLELVVKVSKPEDLKTVVARSNTASIEIPELELRLDPAGQSQSFITNIEGILMRFEEALERIETLGNSGKKSEYERIRRKIELARKGKSSFTVVIHDPQGNSSIVRDYKISGSGS